MTNYMGYKPLFLVSISSDSGGPTPSLVCASTQNVYEEPSAKLCIVVNVLLVLILRYGALG